MCLQIASLKQYAQHRCLRSQRSCLRVAFHSCSLVCVPRSPKDRCLSPRRRTRAAPCLPPLPLWAPPLLMLPRRSPLRTQVVTRCPCQSACFSLRCRVAALFFCCRYPFDHHSVLSAYDTGSIRRGFQVNAISDAFTPKTEPFPPLSDRFTSRSARHATA